MKNDIELGLRIIALEDLICRAFPQVNHEKENVKQSDGVSLRRHKAGCVKCLMAHIVDKSAQAELKGAK